MSDYAAVGAQAFCTTSNETRAVDQRCASHAELDLTAVCDGIEEANEICLGARKAWVGGRGADLRYADWSTGEGCEEEARDQVAVACEVQRLLERFVDGHDGCVREASDLSRAR